MYTYIAHAHIRFSQYIRPLRASASSANPSHDGLSSTRFSYREKYSGTFIRAYDRIIFPKEAKKQGEKMS